MIEVYKAGGAMMDSAENIRFLGRRLNRSKDKTVLVVSAMKYVTDEIYRELKSEKRDYSSFRKYLKEKHLSLAEQLGVNDGRLETELDSCLLEFNLPLGERMMLPIIARYLQQYHNVIAIRSTKLGIKVRKENETNIIDERCIPDVRKNAFGILESYNMLVVSGFEALDSNGKDDHLPRNGSDITATFLANCVDAKGIYILKDVAILGANPKIVEKPNVVPYLDYRTASESGNLHFDSVAFVEDRRIQMVVEGLDGKLSRIGSEATKHIIVSGIKNCRLIHVGKIKDVPRAEDPIRRAIGEVGLNKITQYEDLHEVSYVVNYSGEKDDKENEIILENKVKQLKILLGKREVSDKRHSIVSLSGKVSLNDSYLALRLSVRAKGISWKEGHVSCLILVNEEDYEPTIKNIYNGIVRKRL